TVLLATTLSLGAAPAAKDKGAPSAPVQRKSNLSPLPAREKGVSSHAPFEAGDCSICHKSADRNAPGPIAAPVNDLCLGCHEDFRKVLSRKSVHAPAGKSCVNCHNPHNSRQIKLLVEEPLALCLGCHEKIKDLAIQSAVKHDPVTKGAKCANCHNPHGANVEHLLIRLSFQLCVGCHGKDEVVDREGRKLTNIRKLLEENPKHHGPVAAEDCSACHNPHGFKYFRLLTTEYPATFYSPYDPRLYALCFECHEPRVAAEPETTTLTQFRDGKRNLHYVHINKTERGRTCRACHEVHASKQQHQLREGVPYGSKGWLLKLNYTKTPTGGSCEKTCHGAYSYNNGGTPAKNEPAKKK
ncbi:MAG: cytochrome c3 family protein, partial [Thermodesulfobacteriota bacterium]